MKYSVGLLDTSICSRNLGDSIIMESIKNILLELDIKIVGKLPTHRKWSEAELSSAKDVDRWLVCGTNLLNSYFPISRSWVMGIKEYLNLKSKCILFGVGWGEYQRLDGFSKYSYPRLLVKNSLHSVRDEYTKSKLRNIDFNILNTSCPTIWNYGLKLTEGSRDGGVGKRTDSVTTTLTDYSRNHIKDKLILDILRNQYKRVFFWPQGSEDRSYINELDKTVEILPRSIESFNSKLASGSDYVGTRLHAGIHALELGARVQIISIDNRAMEISRNIQLSVIERDSIVPETRFITKRPYINLPVKEIEQFKSMLVDNFA
jgi:hypothetical protein